MQRGDDLPALPILENKLFEKAEVVQHLTEATIDSEQLKMVEKAEEAELRYAIEQGISKHLYDETDLHMTMKQIFLFLAHLKMPKDERKHVFIKCVEMATYAGPGLPVKDLFEGECLVKAFEWLERVYRRVGGKVRRSKKIFLSPRLDEDEDSNTGDQEQTQVDIGGETEQEVDPDQQQDTEENEPQSEFNRKDIILRLQECTTVDGLSSVIYGRSRLCDVLDPFTYGDHLDTSFEFDESDVYEAAMMLQDRVAAPMYKERLQKDLLVKEEPRTFEKASKKTKRKKTPLESYSCKAAIEKLASNLEGEGKITQEVRDLRDFGFFKMTCFSWWYIAFIEMLSLLPSRAFYKIFLKGVENQEPPSWDDRRKMSVVSKKDILWRLVCIPLAKRLANLGLAGSGNREVGVVSLLRSLGRPKNKPIYQGYHADTDPYFDWGDCFSLSSITAGTKIAYVDLYPKSFDGEAGDLTPVRVKLEPGETLVFSALIRHRGCSYVSENIRFFVSFVYPDVQEQAKRQGKDAETCQLQYEQFEEKDPISFEEWEERKFRT